MNTAAILSHDVGKKAACKALDIPGASFYRHMSKQASEFIRIWFLSLLWFTLIFIRFSPSDIHSRIDYRENL